MGKYYIYWSGSGKSDSEDTKVESAGPLDNFLELLPGQSITLKSKPSDKVGELDASDTWEQWMQNWDASSTLSVTVDDNSKMNIQFFEFHLTTPFDLVFSSSHAILLFAFDTDAEGIPVPGINSDGSPLYFGLDPDKSKDVDTTIKEVFGFAGLGSAAKVLPDAVASLAAKIAVKDSGRKRSALWFAPDDGLQTVVRLQFSIDDATKFLDVLDKKLTSIKFTSVNLICKKAIELADTDQGEKAVTYGNVIFEVGCTITTTSKASVDLVLALEVRESEIDLMFNVKDPSKDTITDVMTWLADQLPDGSGVKDIETRLKTDDIFTNHIHLRRLKVTIDTNKKKLSSVMVDVEVSGEFGNGGKKKRAPFLVTYSWTINGGALGSIIGSFWNWSNTQSVLTPQYEEFSSLRPITKDPVKVLDLETLIPGVDKIPDIPDTVPTQISRATVYLSKDIFAIGASFDSKAHAADDQLGKVPKIDLGQIDLSAWFSWGKSKSFTLELAFTTILVPSEDSKNKTPAYLIGDVKYSSSLGWQLEAKLASLHASTLCEFFDAESADHVLPLIDSLEISRMHLLYKYEKGAKGRSVGSSFDFTGAILVGGLDLDLTFHFDNKNGWKFAADLKATSDETALGDILRNFLYGSDLDLPPFLADTPFNGAKDSGNTIHLEVQKSKDEGEDKGGFHFLANIVFQPVEVVFAQFHSNSWPASTPSKRLVKAGIVALPTVPIPLIGDLTQPFDEMYLLWVQDAANLPKEKQAQPGLTAAEVDDLNTSLGTHTLVYSNKSKTASGKDVVIIAGAHFCVVLTLNNTRTLVLDYTFKRATPKPKHKTAAPESKLKPSAKPSASQDQTSDSDGGSASAPFKTKDGPLSISSLGLEYADKQLRIMFTATMELGPVGLSLIGFSININLAILKKLSLDDISFTLEGLSVSFERPPLTLAGLIRHGKDPSIDYYAGGLIIGWIPYQIQAAGFYGVATPDNSKNSFVSVFVFARLDGPLVTLEFAEISGLTGGFGYNSNVNVPTPDQIVNFPFIKQGGTGDGKDTAMQTLEKLTDPGEGGWFSPMVGTYWAAVGMKIDAFQLIALDAVAVVQFGDAIKLGIFAVAAVDIPNPSSPAKFAHAELGIAVIVDLAYGVMKAESQLSPNSFILHPSCHLTGGCALYYWFEAPHSDHSKVGDFVFTMGGYHPAYEVPEGYPDPPRLGISWSVGGGLSITGEAYFAITPKACMGGGRLHAALHAGPLEAWFDAFANFLINYRPFHFMAEIAINVGVRFNMDWGIVQTPISVDVGAELSMWGPPLAGRVHIDIKVIAFDMDFGDASKKVDPVSLLEFYQLVLQADRSSKLDQDEQDARVVELESEDTEKPLDMTKDEGHTFLAESGLMNDTDKGARDHNQKWVVRGGNFVVVVGCKMAIKSADLMDGTKSIANITYSKPIYARPMQLMGDSQLTSGVEISITRDDKTAIEGWTMENVVKSLPAGLWGEYDPALDPLESGNNISGLLSSATGTIDLLSGVRLTAPPSHISDDPYPVFDIVDAQLEVLTAEKSFPKSEKASGKWDPKKDKSTGDEQWELVRKTWAVPDWDRWRVKRKERVQEEFVGEWAEVMKWDEGLKQVAGMPKWLNKQFDRLYVAVPMMTKRLSVAAPLITN